MQYSSRREFLTQTVTGMVVLGTLGAALPARAAEALTSGAAPGAQPALQSLNGPTPAGPVQVVRDVHYSATQVLDAYRPATPNGRAVLVIHGGGFVRGDKDKSAVRAVAADLAGQGYLALAINYTLNNAAAAVQDGRDAVRWARAHARDYGVTASPVPVAAVGGSAGATLAEMLAVTGAAGNTRVEAAVACSGPTTHRLGLASQGRLWPDPADVDLAGATPLDLYNSLAEPIPFDQARYLYDRLVAAGREARLTALPGGLHAFAYWTRVRSASLDWLAAHL
jgi:acetyl esterase/lipase